MTDFAKVKDHKGLIRDLNSKAILNVDNEALTEHRNRKNVMKKMVDTTEKIEKLENDINQIKDMLIQLIQKNKVWSMITQITTSNTFQQWLTATQLLIEHANYFQNTSNAVFESANLVFDTANTVAQDTANALIQVIDNELININANVAAELANVNANTAYSLATGNVNLKITDQISSSDSFYLGFFEVSSGITPNVYASSTKLQFQPSTGTLSTTNYNSLSDEKFKTNVIVIDSATDIINQLNGVKFTWIENNKNSYGLIAQELEKVIPELVDGNEIKTINYNGIIAFLINAVKELSVRIDRLENK